MLGCGGGESGPDAARLRLIEKKAKRDWKRWVMSKASLTEFTMFGSEYEAIDSSICDGCVFFSKEGDSRCHRSEIIQSASVRGDLSCLSIQ